MAAKMTKGFFVLLGFMFLSFGVAGAMPTDADSNTAQMKSLDAPYTSDLPFAVGLGASGDWVLDRTIDDASDLEVTWYGGNIWLDPLFERFLPDWKDTPVLNSLHVNLFIGTADARLGSVPINNDDTTKIELETDAELAGGVSAKADVWQFDWTSWIVPYCPYFENQPKANLFVSGGYRYTALDITSAERGPTPANRLTNPLLELHEWQAAWGVAQRFDRLLESIFSSIGMDIGTTGISFVPYVGMKYSDVEVDLSGSVLFPGGPGVTRETDMRTGEKNSDDTLGMFTGVQVLSVDDRVSVGVEGRFIDETAVSVNGRVRY